MKCITVQHKDVLRQLYENGEYRADICRVSENLIKPYEFMMEYFGWKSCPIFASPVGFNTNMGGAKFFDGYVAIEIDVPIEYIKMQRYYDWTDFIYFTECPGDFEDACNVDRFNSVEDWAKTILNIDINHNCIDPMQVTLEFIHKDWITGSTPNLSKLDKEQNDSGGDYKLQPLLYYMH